MMGIGKEWKDNGSFQFLCCLDVCKEKKISISCFEVFKKECD
jgi:hypothetical protein